MKSIKATILVMIALVPLMGGRIALGETMEGKIQSFTCVVNERFCPVDRSDPVLNAEKTFVILGQGDTYYLIPNVDRSVLSRNILKKVRVTGEETPKYHAVNAKRLEVYLKGKWREIWSQEQENMFDEYDTDYGF